MIDGEWSRSSFCGEAGHCIEVATETRVLLRDSKDPNGPYLQFSVDEWEAFAAGIRNREFQV